MNLRFAPGSWAWLAAHEARLLWRQWRLDRWASGRGGWIFLILILVVLAHLLAWIPVTLLPAQPPLSPVAILLFGGFIGFAFLFMLGTGLLRSVEALFEPADLDLLFSSPLPPRTVLVVRTLGVAAVVLTTHGLYLLPMANMGLLTGRPWLAGLYLAVPSMALLAAGAGVLLSLALVRTIGARRTRTLVQVLGLLAGGCAYVAWQLGTHQAQRLLAAAGGIRDAASTLLAVFSWPLGWVLLEPWPILTLIGLAALACGLAWGWLDRLFLSGSQQLAGQSSRRVSAAPRRVAASGGPTRQTLRKEWRLIRRDPLVLSRLALSLIYLLPVLALLRQGAELGALGLAGLGGAIVFAAGFLANEIALLAVHIEDAPDLVLGSPRPVSLLLRDKALAAVLPASTVAIVLAVTAAAWAGTVVLWCLPFAMAAACAAALTIAANPVILPRATYTRDRRHVMDLRRGMVIVLVLTLWSGAAALAVGTAPWWGLLLAVLGLPHLVMEWRQLGLQTAFSVGRPAS
jgi:ABC-2 type transport system permease protein